MEILPELQDVMQELWSDVFSVKNPTTGHSLKFSLKKNQHMLSYWQFGPWLYGYTPHHDTDGNYWTLCYKRNTNGDYALKVQIRASRRSVAKIRAYRRYQTRKSRLGRDSGNGNRKSH